MINIFSSFRCTDWSFFNPLESNNHDKPHFLPSFAILTYKHFGFFLCFLPLLRSRGYTVFIFIKAPIIKKYTTPPLIERSMPLLIHHSDPTIFTLKTFCDLLYLLSTYWLVWSNNHDRPHLMPIYATSNPNTDLIT